MNNTLSSSIESDIAEIETRGLSGAMQLHAAWLALHRREIYHFCLADGRAPEEADRMAVNASLALRFLAKPHQADSIARWQRTSAASMKMLSTLIERYEFHRCFAEASRVEVMAADLFALDKAVAVRLVGVRA